MSNHNIGLSFNYHKISSNSPLSVLLNGVSYYIRHKLAFCSATQLATLRQHAHVIYWDVHGCKKGQFLERKKVIFFLFLPKI